MRTLPLEFDKDADKCGKQHFKQVLRSHNAAVYERTKQDGRLFGYEVFKVIMRGPDAYGGERECYPESSSFGKTAWFCLTLERAQERFAAITEAKL